MTALAVIQDVAAKLRQAKRVLFITGAGISADSNLPTYRGIGGLYNDAATDEGHTIEDALSGEMFRVRPDITWKHILTIEGACRGARFNRAHEVIAQLEAHVQGVVVLTQNVDGFHQSAGSSDIIDIHGDLKRLLCTVCDYRTRVVDYGQFTDLPPRCPSCDGVLRPDVVLFGEMLPMNKAMRMNALHQMGLDMVFSVGTSSLFPYIVEPVLTAKRLGIPTVEINPGDTDLSRMVDYKIAMGAADTLSALWDALQGG